MQNEIKMFNSKKGFASSGIVLIILFIFIGIGIILPFVNSEFETSSATFDTGNVADELIEEGLNDASKINAGDIIISVGKMFFWTFGELPFWLDGIFVVLRIILLMILIKTFTPFL